MHNKCIETMKATIISIIVAFMFAGLISLAVKIAFGQTLEEAISLMNRVTFKKENVEEIEPVYNPNKKLLEQYPQYGSKYATFKVDKIDIDLPVYYGDTLEILKYGVGHSSESYFPGEGGSIIYMAHNNSKKFKRLAELKNGDIMKIITSYGEFEYSVYDYQIVKKNEKYKLPIQDEKEILMVYTCYPFTSFGDAPERYVVFAERIYN